MGLDMYVSKISERFLMGQDVDFAPPSGSAHTVIFKWRKHPDLHGWMRQLYQMKGGRDPEFNCNTVRLDSSDIDRLEKEVCNCTLPFTSGPFFGQSEPSDQADDLSFVALARAELAAGHALFYWSWW